jgi:hypothetical protein
MNLLILMMILTLMRNTPILVGHQDTDIILDEAHEEEEEEVLLGDPKHLQGVTGLKDTRRTVMIYLRIGDTQNQMILKRILFHNS